MIEPRELFGLFDWVKKWFDETTKSVVVIYGPRAYGKGECLKVLEDHIPKEQIWTGGTINGRDAEKAFERLIPLLPENAAEEREGRWVFFENLDVFFGQVPADPPSRHPLPENEVRVRAFVPLLQEASQKVRMPEARPQGIGLVITTTRHPAEIFDPGHIVSSFLLPADKLDLASTGDDVWMEGVRRALALPEPKAEKTDAAASPKPNPLSQRAAPLSKETRENLAAYVIEQSDGYPALMLAGLAGIDAWLKTNGNVEGIRDIDQQLRLAARMAMLDEGSAPVRRQLRRFQSSESPAVGRALQVLGEQLQNDPDGTLQALPSAADLLSEAGILRPVKGLVSQYRIARGVLREVLRDALELTPRARVVLRVVSAEERIDVEATLPDGTLRKGSLTGNAYVLGTTLLNAGGNVVSIGAFKGALAQSSNKSEMSEKGTTTALHRFLKDLDKLVPGPAMVENVRGAGYRLARNDVVVERG